MRGLCRGAATLGPGALLEVGIAGHCLDLTTKPLEDPPIPINTSQARCENEIIPPLPREGGRVLLSSLSLLPYPLVFVFYRDLLYY